MTGLAEARPQEAAERTVESPVTVQRDLRLEIGLSAIFLVWTAALLALAPPSVDRPWTLLFLTIALAITARISFPIEGTVAIPTQIMLLPMLMLGPPSLVPVLVFAAIATSGFAAAVVQRRSRRRLLLAGGDSLYCLGPATVFLLAGSPGLTASALTIALAVIAQISLDAIASWVHERWRSGGERRFPVRPYALVWIVDLLLTPVGVIVALATSLNAWSPVALVTLVGLFALASAERGRHADEVEEQLRTVTRERERLRKAVHRIGDAFASTLDLDALLTITTRASLEAVDADAARASATSGRGRKPSQRFTLHEDEANTPLLAAVESRAIESRALAHAIEHGIFAMAAPIGDIETGGVVAVSRNTHEFTVEERQLFQYLCEQASIAAHNVARHASLHRQALTDDLTGLANHRRLQELLADGHSRFLEGRARVGLILLDIDDFKAVNDRHGHQVGDQVLRSVASSLRETCRTTDEPARYGGEELAVVVADAEVHECTRLAERMRRAIEQTEVVAPSGEHLRVTASFGVALMDHQAPDPTTLIAAADAALYRAKYEGKNCVRLAEGVSAPSPEPQPQ